MKDVLLFVWKTFGPYHVARCNAVASLGGRRVRVVGVELAPRSSEYAWAPVSQAEYGFDQVRCFPREPDVTVRGVFRKIRSVVREQRASAVFVPSYWPATSLAMLAAVKSTGVPTIMMNASHDGTAKARGARLLVKRAAVRSFDAALVGGTRHRAHFAALGMPAGNIFIGYDTVDNDLFATRSDAARADAARLRAQWSLPRRYYLSLGRFVTKKNLGVILDAYVRVRRTVEDAPKVVFVGSGACQAEIVARAQSYGLTIQHEGEHRENADVCFYGFRQIDETPAFYGLADAFILPSLEEEWGLVVNEAMASGLPVLVSANAGCTPDLVRQAETGYAFDPSSVDQLTACMREIAADPAGARSLGAAARRHITNWGCDRFARGALAAFAAAKHQQQAVLS